MKIIILEKGNKEEIQKAWKEVNNDDFKGLPYPEELYLHEDIRYKIYDYVEKLYEKELTYTGDRDKILSIEYLAIIIDDDNDIHLLYSADTYSQHYEECSGYPDYYTYLIEQINMESEIARYKNKIEKKYNIINKIIQWALTEEQ